MSTKNKKSRKLKQNPYNEKNLLNYFRSIGDVILIGSGLEGRAYKIKISTNEIFSNIMLKPGEYVLKILYDNLIFDKDDLKRLKILSKYGLIPKIYFINENIIIMKYIEGEMYYYFYRNKNRNDQDLKIIDTKIDELLDIWTRLGFSHGDLNETNILIGKNLNVYFIDPKLYWKNLRNEI